MLDLEERLTRHYTDVATAPSLHRRSSVAPRIAFAGLVLALIAGAAYASGLGSTSDDVIAGPVPEEAIDAGLLRLLERVPDDGVLFVGFTDLDQVRTDPDTRTLDDGSLVPMALDHTTPLPRYLVGAQLDPGALEQAFGFEFGDVRQSLIYQSESVPEGSIIRLDGDLDEVLDTAQADPDWADRVSRRQEGSFDIVDWGDEGFSVLRSDAVRELGQGGQLVGFDSDLLARFEGTDQLPSSENSEALASLIATDRGQDVLADNEQFLDALALVHRNDSLGFMAQIKADGFVDNPDSESFRLPSVMIVDHSLGDSVRVVFGFAPGTDIDTMISTITNAVNDPSEWGGGSIESLSTTIRRDGDFLLIDLAPTAEQVNPLTLSSIFSFMLNASKLY